MKQIQKKSILTFLFLTFLFVTVSVQTFAQKGQQDAVYLKNGSIINGKIIQIKVNESITIVNNCGDTWVIPAADIDRIDKIDLAFKEKKIKDTLTIPRTFKYAGFYSTVHLNFLKGSMEDTPIPTPSILLTAGYQFGWGLNIGAGVGIDLMEESYMPVVIDFRYVFRDSKVSPYIYLNGGYTFALQDPDPEEDYFYYDYYSSYYPYNERDIKAYGGIVINPGIGFKFNISNKNAFLLNLGYKFIQAEQSYTDWNGQEIDRTLKYHRLVLGVAFQF
ncbi:MAG: hypothetical protein A2W99_02595 [Bacteroidetes bacterium GWF2_33_16]|nr:MAG: hypothetical protein A2X00_15560 [Bacteroidetes bacterium GWE2_32_14]OFY07150.1 MAG: hypothetical protein A2W99_02595 [Bacteroidetes bacterium GWF2_33_16]